MADTDLSAESVPLRKGASHSSVAAQLNFYASKSFEPEVDIPWSPVDIPENLAKNKAAGALAGVVREVLNGREDAELLQASGHSLWTRGFSLQQHSSSVQDFWNADEVVQQYYSELLEIARRLTGADRLFVASHVLRSHGPGARPTGSGGTVRNAALFCHGDFSDGFKNQLLEMYARGQDSIASDPERGLGLSEQELRTGRLAVLNLWRPLCTEPLRRTPLAVCDASSMSAEDMFMWVNRVPPGTLGKHHRMPTPILNTVHRDKPTHHWYYFPGMTRDEILIFKTFDSVGPQPANGVGVHTAFEHPDTDSAAPPRESIEARVVCFWASAPASVAAGSLDEEVSDTLPASKRSKAGPEFVRCQS